MNAFELTLLGTSSSQPAFDRFPTSQVLRYHNDLYLIDCGEGTQIQLSRYKIKRNQIKTIFISHLHGDHIFGLPGVVTSFLHYSRKEPLLIIGPVGIRQFVDTCLGLSQAQLNFELNIAEYDASVSQTVYTDGNLEVKSLPLSHRLPTMGYLFKERIQERNLDVQKLPIYRLSVDEMKTLKTDRAVIRSNGQRVEPDEVCLPKTALRTYAFLSDTVFLPSIVDEIKGVDVLYHETTYLNDMEKEAILRQHSTSGQAAEIAKRAQAGLLITGHYSSRYKLLDAFLTECSEIFPNTRLGREGEVYSIGSLSIPTLET